MTTSLAWKNENKKTVFKPEQYKEICRDFRLNDIMSIMSKEPYFKLKSDVFLGFVTYDEETIIFRQKILDDLSNNPHVLQVMEDIILRLDEMHVLHKQLKPDNKIPFLMLRIKKLTLFSKIRNILSEMFSKEYKDILSSEFIGISDGINIENSSYNLKQLEEDIIDIKCIISKWKSIEIGANIDVQFQIREGIITSVNDFQYEKSTFLDKILKDNNSGYNNTSITPEISISGVGQIAMFRNEFQKDLEKLISSDLEYIEKKIEKYDYIITSKEISIKNEIILYYGGLKLIDYLKTNSYGLIFPSISHKTVKIKNFYSIGVLLDIHSYSLAFEKLKVVHNSIDLNDEKIVIVTGPNAGGKTILMESMFIIQVLFQNGFKIPAELAELNVFKKIFSIFPKDENIEGGTGRLGDEAKRISSALNNAGEDTLILMNEPYVTTSPTEGQDILALTIKRIQKLKIKSIIVTHYLGIMDELNNQNGIISYVMEIKNGIRTYKAVKQMPLTESFAMDIAREHGVDYESIMVLIESRFHDEKNKD